MQKVVVRVGSRYALLRVTFHQEIGALTSRVAPIPTAGTDLLELVDRLPVEVALAPAVHELQRVLFDGKSAPAVNGMVVAVARCVAVRVGDRNGLICGLFLAVTGLCRHPPDGAPCARISLTPRPPRQRPGRKQQQP